MKIFEVSQQLNIPEATLRYWEQVRIVPPIHRNGAGVREYDDDDIEWIQFVIMMRKSGVTIKRLQEYTKLFKQGTDTKQLRLRILKSQLAVVNEKFEQFKASRDLLIWKIDHYDEIDQKYQERLHDYRHKYNNKSGESKI
ncbi:MerR family transcriptional regulator [Lactobacillaceae bacterium Melli_B4]